MQRNPISKHFKLTTAIRDFQNVAANFVFGTEHQKLNEHNEWMYTKILIGGLTHDIINLLPCHQVNLSLLGNFLNNHKILNESTRQQTKYKKLSPWQFTNYMNLLTFLRFVTVMCLSSVNSMH